MPIRPATYSDLLPASKCLARAFKNESLFGQYMHPYRDRYPQDMYLYFLHKLRSIWASQNEKSGSTSSQASSNAKQETITGLAHWTRMRSHGPKPTIYQSLSKSLMTSYNYFESFFYRNRAVEPSRTTILSEFPTYCGHFWTGSRAEVFDLTLLGVDPSASGQGHGKELVAWGFEQAKAEGVGCSVIGAEGTEPFYRKCGFDVLVGGIADAGGEKNPLVREGIRGGLIMFWDNGRNLDGGKGQHGET
ncbi:hypothetical protein CERZMDRAFT_50932 [Cercospora zeae-maydis SCOH1-5]|uniref:N-acetyltransferase domain-containing protein n=1 Tax=Cercospora zeae-maydis SCOH1-5 TaxID=717836 RepID=A0A6A6EZE3_9PEZI|nr:hypothetical protein CERZMDRAFT_50932 [Cercospora zeae-maydis SCOH1-5]